MTESIESSFGNALDSLGAWGWNNFENSLVPLHSPINSTPSIEQTSWRLWDGTKTIFKNVFHYLPSVVFGAVAIAICPLSYALSSCVSVIQKTACYAASLFIHRQKSKEIFPQVLQDAREWNDLERKNLTISFDENFLLGPATCTWQDSAKSCPASQWSRKEKAAVDASKGPNLFELYKTRGGRKEVIDRLEKLHANTYRFSIEWSQIEPEHGVFNQANLNVYIDLCKALQDAGIIPIVTLHHFSEPTWFHDAGSFEKEENIRYFTDFVAKVAPSLTQIYRGKLLVPYIFSINEPAIDAFSRYVRGAFSPGLICNFSTAGKYLYHALKAHNAVYDIFKKKNAEIQVGIVHQYLSMTGTNPITALVVRYINRLVNETVLNCARTGRFTYKVPFACHFDESLQIKTDLVGVQYYARPEIGILGPTSSYAPMTQMPFREDPEGLYHAILDTHNAFKKPILVTENGISTYSETQRARYMERALYATKKAQEVLGRENLLGYILWCLCKNMEWDMGQVPNFGAYDLEKDGNMCKEPTSGISPFIETAERSAKIAAEGAGAA